MTSFRMTFGRIIFFCLLLITTASQGFAKSDAEIEEAINAALMQRHPTDTADWWRSLGPSTPRIIIKKYETTAHIYHRMRLIQALGWFDDPIAVEFLKRQAQDATDDVLRNAAIRSVGTSQGAKEEEFVSKYLKNEDPQTRLAAAETLKKMNDPRVQSILEKYMAEETTPWIVSKLKGEQARPLSPLVAVSSSEDRLSPEFAGEWHGYWLEPKSGKKVGMQIQSAILRLRQDSPSQLKGELELKTKNEIWSLGKVSGKLGKNGTQITGTFVREQKTLPFEASLAQEAGSHLFQAHVEKLGATLIVRRNPRN